MENVPEDKNGKPVTRGSVIKLFHFTGRRRKKHYMYKVIDYIEGQWYGIDITSLVIDKDPHKFILRCVNDYDYEIVQEGKI